MDPLLKEVAKELKKRRYLKRLHHEIDRILHKFNITNDFTKVKYGYINKHSQYCSFFCKISENNKLGKEITILVKPDNDRDKEGHRAIRVIIQVGSEIFQAREDEDKGQKPRKVLKREVEDAIKDIEGFIRRAA